MYRRRSILIFGEDRECEQALALLKQYFGERKKTFEACVSGRSDEAYRQIVDANPTLVIVLADGANGMECVYQAKKYHSDMAVFWFSNDEKFSVQSHRLECAYFAEKPLTAEKLSKAFCRLRAIGNLIG